MNSAELSVETAHLQNQALASSRDCCVGWLTIREALTWQELKDYPGVMALPSLGTKAILHCPCCGADRAGVVWNRPAEQRFVLANVD